MSFLTHVTATKNLTDAQQKSAGTPIAGTMSKEHRDFLHTIKTLIDAGEIDPYDQQSFLREEVYNDLDESWQEKTDLALINIAHQLRLIHEFLERSDTPDESPQLQTMVEQLWQMKQQIEGQHDVFKF